VSKRYCCTHKSKVALETRVHVSLVVDTRVHVALECCKIRQAYLSVYTNTLALTALDKEREGEEKLFKYSDRI